MNRSVNGCNLLLQVCILARTSWHNPGCHRSEQIQWFFLHQTVSWSQSRKWHLGLSCTWCLDVPWFLSLPQWLYLDGKHPQSVDKPETHNCVGVPMFCHRLNTKYCRGGWSKSWNCFTQLIPHFNHLITRFYGKNSIVFIIKLQLPLICSLH